MQNTDLINDFVTTLDQSKIELLFLVGSVAKGTAGPLSDIDLLIVVKEKLNQNTKDNVKQIEFREKKFQLIYCTKAEIEKDIEEGLPVRIDQLRSSIILLDKDQKAEKLKKKALEFTFNVKMDRRLEQAEEAVSKVESLIQKEDYLSAKLTAIMHGFWFGRDIIEYHNSAATSLKEYSKELEKMDPEYLAHFKKLVEPGGKEEALQNLSQLKKLMECAHSKYGSSNAEK